MKEVYFFKNWHAPRRISIGIFVITILSFIFIPTVNAELYKWTDSNGVTYIKSHPPEIRGSESKSEEVYYSDEVVMYSTSWCPYCREARNYFRENDISFTEYDVEKSSSSMREFKELGGTGYPLILIGENKIMQGFSEKGFERRYYK